MPAPGSSGCLWLDGATGVQNRSGGTVGIAASGIALLMGVDRILDMCRAAVNVAGDLVACLVMDKRAGGSSTSEEELQQQKSLQEERLATNEDVIVREV